MKILKIIFICSLLLQNIGIVEAGVENKESFYKQLTKAIFQLERYEEIKIEGLNSIETKNIPEGTGFCVRYENNLYIISARHVVDKAYDLRARVKCKNLNTNEQEDVLLKLPKDKWIFHPEKGDNNNRPVDVAVIKISMIKDREIKYFSQYSSGDKKVDQFAEKDPEPPTEVLVFGFPVNLGFELDEEKSPMGRKGIVSMAMEKPFIKEGDKYFDKKAVLVDVDAFPGNSGSPVINIRPLSPEKIKLEGLLIATSIAGRYAVIEPISRIKEVLEIAKEESNKPASVWFKSEHSQ